MPVHLFQAELLGELQLSFVLFVSLSSLRGFRHWQALSALLCRCGDALATNPALFTAFIRVSRRGGGGGVIVYHSLAGNITPVFIPKVNIERVL